MNWFEALLSPRVNLDAPVVYEKHVLYGREGATFLTRAGNEYSIVVQRTHKYPEIKRELGAEEMFEVAFWTVSHGDPEAVTGEGPEVMRAVLSIIKEKVGNKPALLVAYPAKDDKEKEGSNRRANFYKRIAQVSGYKTDYLYNPKFGHIDVLFIAVNTKFTDRFKKVAMQANRMEEIVELLKNNEFNEVLSPRAVLAGGVDLKQDAPGKYLFKAKSGREYYVFANRTLAPGLANIAKAAGANVALNVSFYPKEGDWNTITGEGNEIMRAVRTAVDKSSTGESRVLLVFMPTKDVSGDDRRARAYQLMARVSGSDYLYNPQIGINGIMLVARGFKFKPEFKESMLAAKNKEEFLDRVDNFAARGYTEMNERKFEKVKDELFSGKLKVAAKGKKKWRKLDPSNPADRKQGFAIAYSKAREVNESVRFKEAIFEQMYASNQSTVGFEFSADGKAFSGMFVRVLPRRSKNGDAVIPGYETLQKMRKAIDPDESVYAFSVVPVDAGEVTICPIENPSHMMRDFVQALKTLLRLNGKKPFHVLWENEDNELIEYEHIAAFLRLLSAYAPANYAITRSRSKQTVALISVRDGNFVEAADMLYMNIKEDAN